jgi:hypothetical protein
MEVKYTYSPYLSGMNERFYFHAYRDKWIIDNKKKPSHCRPENIFLYGFFSHTWKTEILYNGCRDSSRLLPVWHKTNFYLWDIFMSSFSELPESFFSSSIYSYFLLQFVFFLFKYKLRKVLNYWEFMTKTNRRFFTDCR